MSLINGLLLWSNKPNNGKTPYSTVHAHSWNENGRSSDYIWRQCVYLTRTHKFLHSQSYNKSHLIFHQINNETAHKFKSCLLLFKHWIGSVFRTNCFIQFSTNENWAFEDGIQLKKHRTTVQSFILINGFYDICIVPFLTAQCASKYLCAH